MGHEDYQKRYTGTFGREVGLKFSGNEVLQGAVEDLYAYWT